MQLLQHQDYWTKISKDVGANNLLQVNCSNSASCFELIILNFWPPEFWFMGLGFTYKVSEMVWHISPLNKVCLLRNWIDCVVQARKQHRCFRWKPFNQGWVPPVLHIHMWNVVIYTKNLIEFQCKAWHKLALESEYTEIFCSVFSSLLVPLLLEISTHDQETMRACWKSE